MLILSSSRSRGCHTSINVHCTPTKGELRSPQLSVPIIIDHLNDVVIQAVLRSF